jgi:hypothetical protein
MTQACLSVSLAGIFFFLDRTIVRARWQFSVGPARQNTELLMS